MPRCVTCGHDLPTTALQCPGCGADIEKTITSPAGDPYADVVGRFERDSASDHGRFEPGTRLGARYRIVGLLGRGGMGEVYRADDLELGQSVALKFLPARFAADPVWLNRFRKEVRIAREIAHPNVCRIYDIAEQDGHTFLSMEYVDGEDLAGVLRRLGRPSREKAIEIARQICLGLAAAHENKVLHRDLKPANIMIDGRGRVRITDFGLAGFLDELSDIESRAGTPAYMAPEQLIDGKVSARSDIYTLGLILYELFTGKSVFASNDVEELKRKHSSATMSTPSSVTGDIDPAVERVIMRCLELDPAHRPQSVYQVLGALPGGDPLAAALAAGETPSPELVANAREAGGLSSRVAIGLVAAMGVCVALTYGLTSRSIAMPDRPPARLSVVAEQIMEELGYGDLPPYSVSGYDSNASFSRSLHDEPRSMAELRHLEWPPRYRYWRRWSDGDFLPSHIHVPEQMNIDGPVDWPDRTMTVALDSRGRLLGLSVPPAMVAPSAAVSDEIDWTPLFARAGLDPAHVTRVDPTAEPTVYCDTVRAWRVERSSENLDPVAVLTGGCAGRPTYFEFVGLDHDMRPTHPRSGASLDPGQISPIRRVIQGTVIMQTGFLLLMVILAVRNIRAGRVDHRSALRCALLVGGLYALLEVVAIAVCGSELLGRVSDLTDGRAAGHILMHGIEAWVYYLAIEPYVRRVWPRMLIGLVRLLNGRWRDPAVGRELLIGLATGCVFTTALYLVLAADWALTADDSARLAHWAPLRAFLSPWHFLSNKVHQIAVAVRSGVSTAGVIVLIRVLVRHRAVSLGLSMVVLAIANAWFYPIFVGGASSWGAGAFAIGIAVCPTWLLTRVGVLSVMGFFLIVLSTPLFGLAFDAWSAPYLIANIVFMIVLGAYAFRVALAGEPLFENILAEPKAASGA